MRVLLVSWEFPPVVVGGLGRHVGHLATELAAAGHDVVVVSRAEGDLRTDVERDDHVRVIGVPRDPPAFDFFADMMPWVLGLGHALVRGALARLGDWRPDVVHAHDWLVVHAAVTLAEVLDVPLVATIHATEAGRHSGWITGGVNRHVHSCEWWLANAADRLIVCSRSMRAEVTALFGRPLSGSVGLAPVAVIPNGIDTAAWPFRERPGGSVGPRVADAPSPPAGTSAVLAAPRRILYFGRLEYEKGVQDLLAALPRLRRSHPGTTLTIAGTGTQFEMLRGEVRRLRLGRSVRFVGALAHDELVAELHGHDLAVLPSRYEPFGIVALEAAACGIPLVTAATGGLTEVVRDGTTGRTFPPEDIAGLAAAVRAVLDDPAAAARMAAAARGHVENGFAWPRIAARTADVYATAVAAVQNAGSRAPQALPEPAIPERPGD